MHVELMFVSLGTRASSSTAVSYADEASAALRSWRASQSMLDRWSAEICSFTMCGAGNG